jgi:hypothetical protein
MKFPIVGASGLRIPEVDAGMVRKVLRLLRPAMALEIGRCRHRQHPDVREFARYQGCALRLAKPDGDVDPVGHEVSDVVAGNGLQAKVGVPLQERTEMPGEHETREQRIDVDAQAAADLC